MIELWRNLIGFTPQNTDLEYIFASVSVVLIIMTIYKLLALIVSKITK